MKKILPYIIIAVLLLNPIAALGAEPAGFAGGVYNEYEYEELVFLTGQPIKFIGELDVSEKEKDNIKTITYKFDLEPVDKAIEGQLKRTIALVIDYNQRNDKGQAIANTTLSKKYSEKVEIGEDEFELEDFQLSKSDVIDKRPASDFYSGNIKGRKYYVINKDEGKIIVDMTGGDVGYENFWGSTETQIIDYTISSERTVDEDTVTWQGTYRANVSDSLTKELRYSGNQANLSSIDGGYVRTTNREIVSKYQYNLPVVWEGVPDKFRRFSGQMDLSKKMVPKVERLIVPKFKDLDGHWGQEYIEKLYSLDVFDEMSEFFTPNIAMNRGEFTKAVMRASDIRPVIEEKKGRSISIRRNEPEEVSPFADVPVDHEDFQYIKEAFNKGLIKGITPTLFEPKRSLTRAQAITVLVRALGFSNKAPNPGYYTTFTDDRDIPYWAKDSIYVAQEIGIVQGDQNNKIWPNKTMTRAEASAMLVRFLEFLERDLQRDYRENIILFN